MIKKRLPWFTLVILSLGVVAAIASGKLIDEVPPPPEISLGVMRSCAQMGALAKRIALDKEEGLSVDKQRYSEYQRQLARRQSLFESPGLALLVAYGSKDLKPETVRNLGVQSCIASYYGFHEPEHLETLYEQAQVCQKASEGEDRAALSDCMGDRYQSTMAKWWRRAHKKS